MNATYLFDEISIELMGRYAPTLIGIHFILPIVGQLKGYTFVVPTVDKITKFIATASIPAMYS